LKTDRVQLLGYLGAGHETTSAVLRWAMCYLVQSQDTQKKLRDALHAIYPEARQQSRRPSLDEILKTTNPFFEAVVEETLRCGMVLPLVMRQAVVDTQILGTPIPKGTSVMMFGMGPGLTVPSVKMNDKSSQERLEAFRQNVGSFDEHNLGDFVPERWLKTTMTKDGQEETVFNPNAGPAMAFGQGPRGCFGKRMALVEIKIFLTLVIWSFEMLPLGPNLSGLKETLGFTRYPTNVYLKLRKLE
jgi:cytochrome P450